MTTRRGMRGRQAPANPGMGAPFTFKAGQGFADAATASKGAPLSNGSNSAGQPYWNIHEKILHNIWTREFNMLSPGILQYHHLCDRFAVLHGCYLRCSACLCGFSNRWFPCIRAALNELVQRIVHAAALLSCVLSVCYIASPHLWF